MSLFDCLSSLPTLLASASAAPPHRPAPVDLLLLGSGWTSSFLVPLAQDAGLRVAYTTRTGSNASIPWNFDPDASDPDNAQSFRVLPDAQTVLIVFPLYDGGAAERLVRGYLASRCGDDGDEGGEKQRTIDDVKTRFILLGSTGIYHNGPTLSATLAPLYPPGQRTSHSNTDKLHPRPAFSTEKIHSRPTFNTEKIHPRPTFDTSKKKQHPHPSPWITASSPYEPVPRAVAEDAFLALSHASNAVRKTPVPTTVLLLCGLWGHGRSARNLIARLPPSKDVFRNLASVHLVHGRDVARAVLALHDGYEQGHAQGRRWILTNQRVYDLWDLASQFGSAGDAGRNHAPTGPFPALIDNLLNEAESDHALPRSAETMFAMTNGASLALDGREFWRVFGLQPEVGWVD